MEQQQQKKNEKLKCQKHEGLNIKFFQVNKIERNEDGQSLFYCLDCLQSDKSLDLSNYFQFKKFINSKIDQVNSEWPPWTDNQFLKKYIQLQLSEEEIYEYENQIIKYFADFKDDLIKEIDLSLKKCIQQIRSLKPNKTELIKKYIELSQINELQKILKNSELDAKEVEKKYRELLIDVTSKSYEITEQLTNHMNEIINNSVFSKKKAESIKESILQNISDIDFLLPQTISIQPSFQNNFTKFQEVTYEKQFNIEKRKVSNKLVDQGISFNQNNNIEIKSKPGEVVRISPDIILSKENSYIFRIQIQAIQSQKWICIGLICNQEYNEGIECSYCEIQQENDKFSLFTSRLSSFKQLKGEGLVLSDEKILEVRINLKEKILQYSDYPYYNNIIQLSDENKHILNKENMRLYLSLQAGNQAIVLREGYIVNNIQ